MSSTPSQIPAPPLDPESVAALAAQLTTWSPLTADDIEMVRSRDAAVAVDIVTRIDELGLVREDVEVKAGDGETLTMSLIHRGDRIPTSPLIYFVHGGGMMLGTRWSGADDFVDWIFRYNAIVATLEYRRAPEHRFPIPQEDCYAGLTWLEANADALCVNVSTGLIAGISAGAGIAAAVALMARDRGGPQLAGQLLVAPMLDDRDVTLSTRQYRETPWSVGDTTLGWKSLLGDLY